MPIHTFEIIRDVDFDISVERIGNTFASFDVSDQQIHNFISDNAGRTTFLQIGVPDDYALRGLNDIRLMRLMIGEASIPQYYILLDVNPLLDQNGPAYLYVPSKENNDNLVIKFRYMIRSAFDCDDDFADLRTWRANRVDYTHDFLFDTKEQAELFKLLPHKTSKEVRRSKIPNKAKKKYEQSAAEGNKSMKVTIYDKVKEVLETREGYDEDTLAFIGRLLGNRVRFEVQCKRKKVISIARAYNFGRNIMNFLDEALARNILRKNYEQTIGTGDFYSEYHCWKKLEHSNLRPSMKTRLFNFLRLIAQARSLVAGRRQFIEGGHQIKHTDIVVEGSMATFNNNLNKLQELHINPVMITRAWASEPNSQSHGFGITFLKNPYDEL